MEPKIVTILSTKCQLATGLSDLYLELNLVETYRFVERTSVRLHSVVGLPEEEELHVFATFVDQVPFGDTFGRYLGSVGRGTLPGPWTRLYGGFLNKNSTVWLSRVDGRPFTSVPEKSFALVLELSDG